MRKLAVKVTTGDKGTTSRVVPGHTYWQSSEKNYLKALTV
jgi:hypothetical protein